MNAGHPTSLVCKQPTEYKRCQGSLHSDTPYLRINTRRIAEEANFSASNPEISGDRAAKQSPYPSNRIREILIRNFCRADFVRPVAGHPSGSRKISEMAQRTLLLQRSSDQSISRRSRTEKNEYRGKRTSSEVECDPERKR